MKPNLFQSEQFRICPETVRAASSRLLREDYAPRGPKLGLTAGMLRRESLRRFHDVWAFNYSKHDDPRECKAAIKNFWDDWKSEEVPEEEVIDAIRRVPVHYAYTSFYIQSGGANANSGSTNSNSPVWSNTVSWTGGVGGGGNDTFVVTDAAASVIAVGDWINIGGSWVSQVTGVSNVGSVYTIVMSTTAAYGTEPATNASIAAKDGGAWADFTTPAAFGATAVPGSTQINVKAATYTLAGALTLQIIGTGPKPIWFRGYNTTIGDLEPGNVNFVAGNNSSGGLSYPTISSGSNAVTINNDGNWLVTAISFSGSRNGLMIQFGASSGHGSYYRCRFANSNSGASNGIASTTNTSPKPRFTSCYFSSPGTASYMFNDTNGPATKFYDCYFKGDHSGSAQTAVTTSSTGGASFSYCTFDTIGGIGIALAWTNPSTIDHCTFNNCGSDSIKISVFPTDGGYVTNCAFFLSGGYDINNASGAASTLMFLANNLSYSPTSGHLTGFGDWAELNPLVDMTDPRVSSTDLHLIPSSAGANAGLPGQWENLTAGLNSQPDVGAWQRNASLPIGKIAGARSIGTY